MKSPIFTVTFCIKCSCAVLALLERLLGVKKSFCHHWKDLFQLYGKKYFKFSFLMISSLCRQNNIKKYRDIQVRAVLHILKRLVGVRKSFYHHWKDLSQLYGKKYFKFSFPMISSLCWPEQHQEIPRYSGTRDRS